MSTIRLTSDLRSQILSHLMECAFGARERELKKAQDALTETIKNTLLPKSLVEKMDQLPKGSFPVVNAIYVQVNGKHHTRHFNPPIRVPYYLKGNTQQFGAESAIAKEHHRLELLKDDLEKQRNEAKAATRAALESVTTLKRLIEVWPEVEPFAKKCVAATSGCRAIAIPIPDLNKKLGLGGNPLPAATAPKVRGIRRRGVTKA